MALSALCNTVHLLLFLVTTLRPVTSEYHKRQPQQPYHDMFHNHHHYHQQQHQAEEKEHGPLQKRQPTNVCPSGCQCTTGLDLVITTVDCSGRDFQSVPALPSSALVVYLQNNTIRFLSCHDFSALLNLTELYLARNKMTRLDECIFASQGSLQRLDISMCSISSLGLKVFHPLKNLVHLEMSGNNLTDIEPFLFSQMSKLQYLNMYDNTLSHIGNDSFFGLWSLRFLSLQKNKLLYTTRTFDAGAFRGLDALENLNLHGNQPNSGSALTYPDIALSSLTNLRQLHMDGYPVVLGPGFRNLTRLSVLDLSRENGRTGISYCFMHAYLPEDFFSNFVSKEPLYLNLSNCGISNIPSKFFMPVPNIYSLILNDNQLDFDSFEHASKGLANSSLTYLDLTHSVDRSLDKVFRINNSTFQYLKHTKLKTLILGKNRIYGIDPKAISDLPSSLQYLCLHDNYIQSAEFLRTLIFLLNLKVLDGSYQLFYRESWKTGMDRGQRRAHFQCMVRHDKKPIEISGNPSLKINEQSVAFDIPQHTSSNEYRDTRMATSISTGFIKNSHVQCRQPHLLRQFFGSFASDNSSDEITIPLPKSLEVLYASNIKVNYAIPAITVFSNKVLRYVDYSGNMARCWQGPIKGVPSLQYLDLSNNACTQIGYDFFKYLTNLTTLLLNDNDLGQPLADDVDGVIFSTLINLKTLDLRRNAIKDLADTAFINNVRLQLLSLNGNELTEFRPTLKRIQRLEHLDLSVNTLTGLSEETCQDLELLKARNENFTINVQDNRFLCSCEFRPFLRLLIHSPTIFKEVQTFECALANNSVLRYAQLEAFFPELERQCQAETVLIIVIIAFFILFGSTSIFAVFYYNRWKLTYLYYIGQRRMRIGATPITYMPLAQVFLTYDQEELRWRQFLQREFLQRLKQERITYVLGEVDFEGGHRLPQVTGAIVGTRKTLVLLSRGIFDDDDRRTEMNLAIMHELNTGSDLIVPVWVEPVNVTSYPLEIATFLQNQCHRCLVYRNSTGSGQNLPQSLEHRNDP